MGLSAHALYRFHCKMNIVYSRGVEWEQSEGDGKVDRSFQISPFDFTGHRVFYTL